MKTICNLSLSALLLASLSFAQTATTQTTLAQAVSRGDKTITLTACSTVQPAGLAPVTGLFMDREYDTVISNVSPTNTGCTFNVQRVNGATSGVNSTHASGTTVWVGNVGGNSPFDQGPYDRVGACTATNFPYLPIIEIRTGNLVTCGSNGAYARFAGTFGETSVGAAIASATTVVPQNRVTHITGTTAIVNITVPPALPDGGSFTFIPDGAYTYTAAGNIVSTGTGIVGKAMIFTYDKTTGKLYPSY
jgi:hypothetical protein